MLPLKVFLPRFSPRFLAAASSVGVWVALAISAGCQGPDEFYRLKSDASQTGTAGSSSPGAGGTTGAAGTSGRGGTGGGPTGTGGAGGSARAAGAARGNTGAAGSGAGGTPGPDGGAGTAAPTGGRGGTTGGRGGATPRGRPAPAACGRSRRSRGRQCGRTRGHDRHRRAAAARQASGASGGARRHHRRSRRRHRGDERSVGRRGWEAGATDSRSRLIARPRTTHRTSA